MLINTSQQKRAFWETWVLLTGLIMWIGHRKEIQKLTFRALALPGANQGVMGCVWFIHRNREIRYWLVPGNVKNNWINKLNEKRSLIPLGLRVPIWKINFCSKVLRLSVFPWWREKFFSVSPHSPSPFSHSLQTALRSHIDGRPRSQKIRLFCSLHQRLLQEFGSISSHNLAKGKCKCKKRQIFR